MIKREGSEETASGAAIAGPSATPLSQPPAAAGSSPDIETSEPERAKETVHRDAKEPMSSKRGRDEGVASRTRRKLASPAPASKRARSPSSEPSKPAAVKTDEPPKKQPRSRDSAALHSGRAANPSPPESVSGSPASNAADQQEFVLPENTTFQLRKEILALQAQVDSQKDEIIRLTEERLAAEEARVAAESARVAAQRALLEETKKRQALEQKIRIALDFQ